MNFNDVIQLIEEATMEKLPNGGRKRTCDDGVVIYYDAEGNLHREDGPAVIEFYTNDQRLHRETWYKHGRKHRLDGPANIQYYHNNVISSKAWYVGGVNTRKDGPAEIEYFQDGSLSRESYRLYGQSHRLDGPAHIEYFDGDTLEEYYIKGRKYDKEDFDKQFTGVDKDLRKDFVDMQDTFD